MGVHICEILPSFAMEMGKKCRGKRSERPGGLASESIAVHHGLANTLNRWISERSRLRSCILPCMNSIHVGKLKNRCHLVRKMTTSYPQPSNHSSNRQRDDSEVKHSPPPIGTLDFLHAHPQASLNDLIRCIIGQEVQNVSFLVSVCLFGEEPDQGVLVIAYLPSEHLRKN